MFFRVKGQCLGLTLWETGFRVYAGFEDRDTGEHRHIDDRVQHLEFSCSGF